MCGSSSRVVKISDFGMAVHLRLTTTRLTDRCGTLAYMPPEVLSDDDKSFAGPPLDYWALGNILFALLCGRLPFLGVPALSTPFAEWPSTAEIESNIISCQYEFEPHASEESQDVVQILLHKNPLRRTLITHAWARRSSMIEDLGKEGTTLTPTHTDPVNLSTYPISSPYQPILFTHQKTCPITVAHSINLSH